MSETAENQAIASLDAAIADIKAQIAEEDAAIEAHRATRAELESRLERVIAASDILSGKRPQKAQAASASKAPSKKGRRKPRSAPTPTSVTDHVSGMTVHIRKSADAARFMGISATQLSNTWNRAKKHADTVCIADRFDFTHIDDIDPTMTPQAILKGHTFFDQATGVSTNDVFEAAALLKRIPADLMAEALV